MSISLKAHPGWTGLGVVVIVVAGLAGACAAILPIKVSFSGPSGPEWCRNQAASRPFVKLVNEGTIGGPNWPTVNAFGFWFHLFNGPPRLGAEQGDYRTVADAFGANDRDFVAARKIPVAKVPAARAAALRLDHYCANN